MIELLRLYKAFVIFDLLPCMAFTISDKKNKQFKKTVQLKKDPKIFLMSVTLTFHISMNVLSPPKVKDNSWLERIQLDSC